MKRKRNAQKTLFILASRRIGAKKSRLDDPDEKDEILPNQPQIELILKNAPEYNDCFPLPYEMIMKIFHYAIESSDHPLRDLCSLARVCEAWRQLIIQTPSLWARIDLSQLPITERNVLVLEKIFKINGSIMKHVDEVRLRGGVGCKTSKTLTFVGNLLTAPNLTSISIQEFRPQNQNTLPGLIVRSVEQCKKLRALCITHSRNLFNNQKWLADHLLENGAHLESLNLAMSLTSISSQLFRAVGADYCPRLRILDISTCDALNTHSFDAIQLSQNMPNLEILRVGNISFKRVYNPPERLGLTKLKELSMPIGMRDADRDDALFTTLTFGSDSITSLDLRGSSISAHALLEMPSYGVRELHIDDLCPINRFDYQRVIRKWSRTLEVLSLVKINCSDTVNSCLKALYENDKEPRITELDLSTSDVAPEDLRNFLKRAKLLSSINLSGCRSLPRGSKGVYSKEPIDRSTQKLSSLLKKLK